MKKISILGATGTIGDNSLAVIRKNRSLFQLETISGKDNWQKLADMANEFQVPKIYLANEKNYTQLKTSLNYKNVEIYVGDDLSFTEDKAALVISAISGVAGLKPTMKYIENQKNIVLANKESLICAGYQLMKLAKKNNVKIFPADSEHQALFQLFHATKMENIREITITASGGPFLNYKYEDLNNVTCEQATNHPKWRMGKKNSIDSATMANKALEIMEAHILFELKPEKINAVIHPQAIIHAMINLYDNSCLLQAYKPTMEIPISYCLNYPEITPNNGENISWSTFNSKLEFMEINRKLYPAFYLGKQVLAKRNQSQMIIYNIANEIAVERFINGYIKFIEIAEFIAKSLEIIAPIEIDSLDLTLDYIAHTTKQLKTI